MGYSGTVVPSPAAARRLETVVIFSPFRKAKLGCKIQGPPDDYVTDLST